MNKLIFSFTFVFLFSSCGLVSMKSQYERREQVPSLADGILRLNVKYISLAYFQKDNASNKAMGSLLELAGGLSYEERKTKELYYFLFQELQAKLGVGNIVSGEEIGKASMTLNFSYHEKERHSSGWYTFFNIISFGIVPEKKVWDAEYDISLAKNDGEIVYIKHYADQLHIRDRKNWIFPIYDTTEQEIWVQQKEFAFNSLMAFLKEALKDKKVLSFN